MANQHLSKCFMSELTSRINKLHQYTQDTGLNLTDELLKTLQDFSDDSRNSPSFNLSQSSDLENPSPLLQPTNSILSVISSESISPKLKTSIPNTHPEASKKPINPHKPPKDQFSLKKSNSKSSLLTNETLEKSRDGKNRSKSQDELAKDSPSPPFSSVFSEIAQLKSELEKAKRKIVMSKSEMERQRSENMVLKSQLKSMLESNQRINKLVTCDCQVI